MRCFIELNRNNVLIFVIVYLSFLLDNVLLTVVVPIIPDFLFSNDLNITSSTISDPRFGPASLSPLQRKYETLERDNGPLGALLASKAFVQLAFTPLIGYLIGRLGCNVPLLIGSCNMLLASVFFAYGNSYGFLVLARALHGSASAAVAVSGMCILAKNLPDDFRAKLMPLAFGGIGLGVLIGYPMGGAAYQTLGKTASFIFIAIFICFNIVLQLVFLQEEEENIHQSTVGRSYSECIGLLRDNQILLVTITICVCTSTMAILEPCVPIWLLGKMDPPPSKWQLGAIFIPDSIGYFIGSNFTGLLPVKPWRIAFCALVMSGLSCCFLPLADTISQLSLPHFCIGLGVGMVDAALVPMLAALADRRGAGGDYGPIYALQQASVAVAYSVGPLLAGQAVHLIGFLWAMRIAGFADLVMCPFMVELNYEEDQEDKEIPLKATTTPFYSSTELQQGINLIK